MTPRTILHSTSALLIAAALVSVLARHMVDRHRAILPDPSASAVKATPGHNDSGEELGIDRQQLMLQRLQAALRLPYAADRDRGVLALLAGITADEFPVLMDEIEAEGWMANWSTHDIVRRAWVEVDAPAALTWLQQHGQQIEGLPGGVPSSALDWAIDACNREKTPPLDVLGGAIRGLVTTDPAKANETLARLSPSLVDRFLRWFDYQTGGNISLEEKRRWIDSAASPELRASLLRFTLSNPRTYVEESRIDFYRSYEADLDPVFLRSVAAGWAFDEKVVEQVAEHLPGDPLLDAVVVERSRYLVENGDFDKAVEVLSQHPESIDSTAITALAGTALTGNPASFLDRVAEMPESPLRTTLIEQTLSAWRSAAGSVRADRWLAAHDGEGDH